MENDLKFTMTAIIAAVKSGKEISIRISGTSMLPTFQNGDMVCIRSHPNYQVGDILDIIRNDHFIVHRLVGLMVTSKGKYYLTKGDHNTFVDRWYPHQKVLAKVISQN